jgi:hypothetical protein
LSPVDAASLAGLVIPNQHSAYEATGDCGWRWSRSRETDASSLLLVSR